MPHIDLASARVFYEEAGSGPPMLLVHGWTCDSTDWCSQINGLCDRYRVVVPDLPGHGRSPRCSLGHHPVQLARVLEELLSALGAQPCTLVGHSLGSAVAARMAVDHPDRTVALVAVEPAYGLTRSEASDAFRLIRHLQQHRDPKAIADFLATLDRPTTPPQVRQLHMQRLEHVDVDVALEMLSELWERPDQMSLEPSTSQFLCYLRRPLLELYTDEVQTRWRWDTARAANWRRECWPGLGHWPHQERPQQFNALVSGWLASLDKYPEAKPAAE